MNESSLQNFGMVQNWEILDLVMVNVGKVNITVTYYCQPSFFICKVRANLSGAGHVFV
jgi:hypothetical protein